jgi:hypothetical protein
LQKQNSIQWQVFSFVFYQLELCGEKSNRNLNNFFFDVAHNFFSILADIHTQCGIFVWLIASKRNRHFSSSTQLLATSLGQDLHQERSPRSPYSEHGSDIRILFHSGTGLTELKMPNGPAFRHLQNCRKEERGTPCTFVYDC